MKAELVVNTISQITMFAVITETHMGILERSSVRLK